ncbi:MAG: PBP1A family penicillin-binding protein [Candidatus Gastranaerophilales bacterium]|nr:PBP1A family penicillin-binding protein [Candidatus Gastranaerophilales bacterium]
MRKKRINKLSLVDIPTQSEIERRRLIRTVFLISIGLISGIILIISLLITNGVMKLSTELPDISVLKEYKPDQTSLIYDINNKLVANIHGDEDRVVIPLNKISPHLQRAVIAIEDNRFYNHGGIDLIGTLRAASTNFSGSDSVQGGSSITQQLVKNSFLSPERSIKRKLIEAILAVRIERIFNKDKILEMYLNQIYWGNLSYGAEKAAKRYFKIPASELNLAQATLLAGLIKAPEGYSPYKNFKAAKLRQKIVLQKMEYYGYITHKQRILAEKEQLKFAARTQSYSKYPYFVDYVTYMLRKMYGNDLVRRGGLKVYTTLDPKAQELAEKTISEGIKSIPKGSGVRQGSLVSIDVNTGYVQALVGGNDFAKSNYNRAVYAKRAAGSSFKPVVYLTGLRLGKITPESLIIDAPISFNTGWNIWCPHNWDGKYMGKMTIRKALTLSRNTCTVRIALKVGIDAILETARKVGIKSKINRDYSITLGSLCLSPLEMATVYSTFARQGAYIEPICIRKVIDAQGNIIEVHQSSPIQIVSPDFVRQLNSILVDVVEKGTGRLAKLDDRSVAGKTGTTDNVKDIWFTGFTPDTVTSIWMGNDENQPLKGVFSSNCAQLWGIYMKEFYKIKKIPPRFFTPPDKSHTEKLRRLEALGKKEKTEKEKAEKIKEMKEKLKIEKLKIEKTKKKNKPELKQKKKIKRVNKDSETYNRKNSDLYTNSELYPQKENTKLNKETLKNTKEPDLKPKIEVESIPMQEQTIDITPPVPENIPEVIDPTDNTQQNAPPP